MPNRADLVLEGGGVRGFGAAGAVIRLLEEGYTFPRVAGTSVGAIVAAFTAAGMSAGHLRDLIERLDLRRIPDRYPPPVPFLSEGLALWTRRGAYRGDWIHNFIGEELAALGVETFGDLRREDSGADPATYPQQSYKLVVMATDITHGRLLRLPWDYHRFHLPPDEQLVADAVRASLSIPFYFRPRTLTDRETGETSVLVDGGVLSNFAIECFDRTDGKEARWPTFGVRIIPDLPESIGQLFPVLSLVMSPPLRLLQEVVSTGLVGHDQTHLDRPGVRDRCMTVDCSGVCITDFTLGKEGRSALLDMGLQAADDFLLEWRKRHPDGP
ncbi:patatin-like phospholipase family protein [Streptomyces ochraceiscleroticus]|uniref:Patatin-like phospholipase family protein n=1 Tax=Streptomyces ochraceiscleroticus TaxID=47761 RepID=A0ABW1MTI8_9ACTN|nr:patatin-like phospholipase family protein [Streptomyces ochraceiscleroticus]